MQICSESRMSKRPHPLTASQQIELGGVVSAMRACELPWKVIEAELGMNERHLRRCVSLALMSDLRGGMSGPGACETSEVRPTVYA